MKFTLKPKKDIYWKYEQEEEKDNSKVEEAAGGGTGGGRLVIGFTTE